MPNQECRPDDRERVEITPEEAGSLEIGPVGAADWLITSVGHVGPAAVFFVEPGSGYKYASDADEVFVIHWEDENVIIPWPEGMTVKEAIMTWAEI